MTNKTSEKRLERNRQWRKNNPEKFKLSKEKWKKNNLEKYREIQREWAKKKRREKAKPKKPKKKISNKKYDNSKYSKKWNKENREKMNEYNRRRKVIKRGVIENFSNEEWQQKLKSTEGVCPGCKKYFGVENLTIDHSPPISKVNPGFVYDLEKVSPLCVRCNSKKSNRI